MLEGEPRRRTRRNGLTTFGCDGWRPLPVDLTAHHRFENKNDLALAVVQRDLFRASTSLEVFRNLEIGRLSEIQYARHQAVLLTSTWAWPISRSFPRVLWSSTLTLSLLSFSSKPNLNISFLSQSIVSPHANADHDR